MKTKIKTPYSTVKDTFKQIEKFLKDAGFKNFDLNKSAPKYNPREYKDTKGVTSDYIRIYKHYNTNKQSFSFAFNGGKDDVEKAMVTVVIKNEFNNKVDFDSNIFILKDFKVKLKEFRNSLKILNDIKQLNFDSVIVALDNTFNITKNNTFETLTNNIVKKIEDETKKVSKNIENNNVKIKESVENLNNAKISFNKDVDKFKKEIDFDKIEKEYNKLKEQVTLKTKYLKKKHDLTKVNSEVSKYDRKKNTLKYEYDNIVSKNIATQPKHIQSLIKKSLKIN